MANGLVALTLLILNSVSYAAVDKEAKEFLNFPQFEHATLSPDGQHVAFIFRAQGAPTVAILKTATLAATSARKFPDTIFISNVHWVTNTKVIIEVVRSDRPTSARFVEQAIFSMDVTGSEKKKIFPERIRQRGSSEAVVYSVSDVLNTEPVDQNYILVAQTYESETKDTYQEVKLANINREEIKFQARFSGEAEGLALDNENVLRVGYISEKKSQVEFYTKNLETNQWDATVMKDLARGPVSFLGFDTKNETLYFLASNKAGMNSLFRISIDKKNHLGKPAEIFSDSDSDIWFAYFDKTAKEPVFVDYGFGYPKRKYVSSSDFSKLMQELDKNFPDERIYPVDRRGDLILLSVISDKRPQSYYLFNQKTSEVRKFLANGDKLNLDKISPSKLVSFKARDGKNLNAYFTAPKNQKPPFPIVIHVNSGPLGNREEWDYNGVDQFFASQGYGVLRVNHRGLGGQGRKFEEAAFHTMGVSIPNDLADAAKWMIDQKLAESGRICLWGNYYGGYTSALSLMRSPELFRCAVAFGGLYDLTFFGKKELNTADDWSKSYLDRRLPKTEKERLEQSPISQVSGMKGDLYVMHGDSLMSHIPLKQAQSLKSELKSQNKAFKYKTFSEVDFWFKNQNSMNEAFSEMLTFFSEKIGTKK